MTSALRTILIGAIAIVLLARGIGLHAQGLTGTISGTLLDSSQGVLPGAPVTIRNVETSVTREAQTTANGSFVFPDLLAGTFELTVDLNGFKKYEQKGIELAATQRLVLQPIALQLGSLSEVVSVEAETIQVQTTTGERSALITSTQINDTGLKGRDFMGILKTLPGVVDTSQRDAPGWGSVGGLTVNGRASFNFSYDGVTNKDTGSNSGNWSAPGLDSIAEVRVQTSNFQAEYGRSSGATITVVTKSGTHDFSGSAAYYKRSDKLNGNEFSRRQQHLPAANYNYDNTAWTLGGPLTPGRNKLFFFWSQDLLPRTDPGSLTQRRMPTALERTGDFSQTFDAQGRLVFIRDPLKSGTCNSASGGPACFDGNIIPKNRFDPIGLALLNQLPLPNATDPTGTNQYNYVFQSFLNHPRSDQVARVDWNISPETTFYSRLQFGHEAFKGGSYFLGSGNWPQYPMSYAIDSRGLVNTLLHTFSPTLVSEVTVGLNWAHQNVTPLTQAAVDANDVTKVVPGFRQFFPEANPLHILPQANFGGGVPGSIGSLGVENRFPFYGWNTLWNYSANLTKLAGAHHMKAGVFVEQTTRPAARASSFNGTLTFDNNSSNPLNTNVGFANALLGSVSSYTESNIHPKAHGAFSNVEWFVQDNWRVARTFTIDAGVRFYLIKPTRSQHDKVAMFLPSNWQSTQAPSLFQPTATSQGRQALNPLTGQIVPSVYIGRLVAGSGDPINGMKVFDETVMTTPPIKPAPRLGFAWDPTGDGRTAVRGGAGVFYDRFSDDTILSLVEQPPLVNTYVTNFTTVTDLQASPLTATPRGVNYIPRFIPPVVYNWSLGVQRDLGMHLIADVAYVGNAARYQSINRALNGRPYGYTFLPQSLDPTNVLAGQAQPLPTDFLRPYQGYGSITQTEFTGYSDYHSMQLSLNRRSINGLAVGGSYTYEIVSKGLRNIDPFLSVTDNRARYYNSNGRRPHTLTINYSYQIPNLSKTWSNPAAKVLDDWQISGITSILSGQYTNLGFNFTNQPTGALIGTGAIDAPGGGSGASRVALTCNPNLPRGQRTFQRQFRTECVSPPTDPYLLGTSMADEYLGLGYMNWDISLFKNVGLGGSRRLQLRIELYNAFNTTQWSAVNTTGTFDYITGQQTNTAFGQLTGATRDARRIQLGARFTF